VTTNKNHPVDKQLILKKGLHLNNLHRQGYDFALLANTYPLLKTFVAENAYGNLSIDFSDAAAVKALNAALLEQYYGIVGWNIPEGFLCPPIPGRVDYLHYVADLLAEGERQVDVGRKIRLLDIGTGANGIYSLLASKVYGWQCVASDIDPQSLANVAVIIDKNPSLKGAIDLRLQPEKSRIFAGIIQADEAFDVSVCNPPFHASLADALKGNQKKRNNLGVSATSSALNFGGQNAELWCKGGEQKFLRTMIKESREFSAQCRWFTSLVSKSENLAPAKKLLRKLAASDVREIEMKQGNKITRILAWTYS
jgi:23S rRNA (adenine1618-N6)-methyltransferase